MSDKDVIVTGADGFIGGHLVTMLCENGYNVKPFTRKDGDINSKHFWSTLPQSKLLVHLAGRTSVVSSWDNQGLYISEILASTQLAIDWCCQNSAELVFPSSYIYGHPKMCPINENHPIIPSNPYALSKYFAEQLISFANLHKGLKATILRLFNVYGHGQSDSFLISHIVKQVPSGLVYINDLTPQRDYVHINDVCSAFVLALKRGRKQLEIINIGSGVSVSVGEVLEICKQVSPTQFNVVCKDVIRTNEVSNICAEITKAKAALGWHPKISLYNGLKLLLNHE